MDNPKETDMHLLISMYLSYHNSSCAMLPKFHIRDVILFLTRNTGLSVILL